jgi:SNF2 family DNA or RNA helicase
VAVCDESHRIKTHDSKQSKYAAQLGKAAAFRLCLTGTPMPHSPLDLFGQFRFLDRGVFGTWFHHFRNRYAKLNPIFPSKVDAWLNQDELKQRFSLLAYRVTADEVLDLPPVMHEERRVTLCPKAKKIYESLEDDLIADVGSGVVTATNALTRLLRLQQLTSGYVIEDDTKRETEVDDAKKLALFELLDDIGPEPVVVFCRFRHDLVAVADCAEKLGREYGELSGRFKHGLDDRGCMVEGVQVMGVQIQSGGVGVDLTRARYCVFFSQCWSLGDFDQALARVHRPGQTRPVSYYHLVAGGTIDDIMRKALEAKRDVVEMILEALRR